MDIADLKQKSTAELHRILREKRDELRELRFKVHEGQLKQMDKIKKVKKDIARVLTVINDARVTAEKQA